MRMRFNRWCENHVRGYGGANFNPDEYRDEYRRREYLTYGQMYDDVQLELDNSKAWLKSQWGIEPREVIWFQDSLQPGQYKSDLTVDGAWKEDYDAGVRYLDELHEWLAERDSEGVDPGEYTQIDQSSMKCIRDLCGDYDWDGLRPDDWDWDWGPYQGHPDSPGEWSRCRDIALSDEEYPVVVLGNGSMIDGAHRLAVAMLNGKRYYPCLIGFPYLWFESESGR